MYDNFEKWLACFVGFLLGLIVMFSAVYGFSVGSYISIGLIAIVLMMIYLNSVYSKDDRELNVIYKMIEYVMNEVKLHGSAEVLDGVLYATDKIVSVSKEDQINLIKHPYVFQNCNGDIFIDDEEQLAQLMLRAVK